LTFAGLALRAVGSNSQLWYDEIYSLVESSRPPLYQILTTYCGDIQHPLNSVLVHASIVALGETAWTVRLPAILFGVASIPLLFMLGRTIANTREALLASAFLTCSYHHVWFSQNARGYTGLLFWTLLCTLLLYRGVTRWRWQPLLGYSVAAALGAYTHMTLVFVVVGHAATILLLAAWTFRGRWDSLRRLVAPSVAVVLAGFLTLGFYAPIIIQVIEYFRKSSGRMKALSTPSWAMLETLRGLQIGFGSQVVLAIGVLLVGCGLWGYWRENRLAFLLLVLPAVVAGLGVVAMRGSMYPRYLFLLFGFAILIVVRGAMVLGAWIGEMLGNRGPDAALGRVIGNGCMMLVIAASASSLPRIYRRPKQDFSGALRFIESERRGTEPVLAAGAAAWPYQHYYGRDWPKLMDIAQIELIRGGAQRVWLVYTFPRYIEDETPGLMDAIGNKFKTIRVFSGTLEHGEVFVCVNDCTERPSL
jgi:4-amino-4-deoxy-L-arabinose transferase-like glycosyltransferase